MSRLHDQLAGIEFDADHLSDGEVITDVIVVARVMRLSDGRRTVLMANNESIDIVSQIDGWNPCECDDEDAE